MVLISVQSVETNNGYQFKNDFSETIEIDPKASISVVNALFERENKFIVTSENNRFDIALSNESPTEVVLKNGTYTGAELAEEIQYALYINYGGLGIYFSVSYQQGKPNTFNIDYSYEPQSLKIQIPQKFTFQPTPQPITVDAQTKIIDFNNTGINKHSYALTHGPIETTVVPGSEQGGSFIEATINASGGQLTPSGGLDHSSWLFGLTSKPASVPAYAVGALTYNFIDIGIVFDKRANGVADVYFIEKGTQTAEGAMGWEVKSGDTYKIVLSGIDNAPEYWYKRLGGRYRQFAVTSHLPVGYWFHKPLQGIWGADHTDAVGDGIKWKDIRYTPAGSNMIPETIQDIELNAHTLASGNILNRTYDATNLYLTNNAGALTKKIDANITSQITFKNGSGEGGSGDAIFNTVIVSVLDENQRFNNAAIGSAFKMGNAFYGNTTDASGTKLGDGNCNPAILSFEFNRTTEKITRRESNNDFSNPANSITNEIVRPNHQDIPTGLAAKKWTGDTTFNILLLAEAEEVVITCNEKGTSIPADDIVIHRASYLDVETVLTGVNDFTLNTTGTGWTDGTIYWFRVAVGGNAAVIQVTGQADGSLASPVLIKSGKGYNAGAIYTAHPIVITTGAALNQDATTNPTIQVTNLWTTDIPTTSGYSTTWKTTGTNGYRWHMVVPDWQGAETLAQAGTTINNISYQGLKHIGAPVVKFLPRVLPAFGDLTGFSKSIYTFDESADFHSDSNLNALSGKDENISINIDNLPIKSYIGKGYLANSTLNTSPLGSQQGVTRTVAVLPRDHEENGNAGTGTIGPYYYDYFPYSIPLHNAVELNVNELEITLKNRDGTLATDITKTSLLLNISKVDNMGEGSMGGSIGNPIKAGRNYDRLDIDKTLRVGNMAPSGSSTNGAARHARADFSNSNIGSGKDKTYAL